MTLKNPIGTIKNVAAASLKVPATVAGTAVDLAKGAVGTVGSVVGGDKGGHEQDRRAPDPAPAPTADAADDTAAAAEAETDAPAIDIKPDQPVNVTEELGLDPAPVEKPKKKPVTKIDAAADPSEVDVTPADIAPKAGKQQP